MEAQFLAVKTANVRAEPTVRSATITVLGRGTRVHVAGKVKGRNWYLVERDEKPLGYVFGDLLKQPEPPATQPPGAVKPAIARDESRPVMTAPPSIETEEAIIEVSGTVRDQSRVVDLSLDGQPIALGADGGFNVRRGVPLGESQIALVAVDEWGNRADRVVRVVRRRPTAAQVAIARDSTAPLIDVPARIETAEATVAFAGKVADASRVVELTVDGRPIALASDGSFAIKRGVGVGRTSLKLAAVDE